MPTSLHGAVKVTKPVIWLSSLEWSSEARLQVVPHFSSGIVERAQPGKKFFSLPAACHLFWRGVIFTHARISLALLSMRKNGGLLVV